MSLLTVSGLSVSFRAAKAVDDVSFAVSKGEVFGIVGESGSGKSMTALSILGLLPAGGRIDSGSIDYAGHDLLKMGPEDLRAIRGARISMVFQEPGASFDPVFTIGSQMREAVSCHKPEMTDGAARELCVRYLEEVHIKDIDRVYASYPHELSGGMKQRVMIAMALVNSPDIVILDEPTTALDVTIQAEILGLLKEIRAIEKLTMIFISHDIGVISAIADRVAVMNKGRIVESGTKDAVVRSPKDPYTARLMDAARRLSCR